MHQTFRSALLAAAVVGGGVGFSTPAAACDSEPYVGSICTFAMDWCPRGYLPADGRTLTIREYTALFGLLGFTYGGDNTTQFAIPDLRGRSTIGTGQGTNFTQDVSLGQKLGQQAITLTTAQVPLIPHTHTATFTGTGGGGSGPLTASGTINLPVTAPSTGLTATASNVSLPVTGKAVIGTSSTVNRSATISDKAVISSSGGPAALIFAPPGATNDRQLGPDTAVSGTATGAVTSTVSGSITGAATGTVRLPVTGATGITGGTVTVGSAGQGTSSQSIPMYSPSMGQTVCIAALGLFPNRP